MLKNQAWSSASVVSGTAAIRSRSASSWSASLGFGPPPDRRAVVSPLARRRPRVCPSRSSFGHSQTVNHKTTCLGIPRDSINRENALEPVARTYRAACGAGATDLAARLAANAAFRRRLPGTPNDEAARRAIDRLIKTAAERGMLRPMDSGEIE